MTIRRGGDGVYSERIRLAGVWAPGVIEADPRLRLAARESMNDLFVRAKGRLLRVDRVPELSKNQTFAFVYLVEDGSCLNETLVRDGFGFHEPEHSIGDGERDRIIAAERAAMTELVGLWGPVEAIRTGIATRSSDKQAANWLAMANGLKDRNPAASEEWYRKILAEAPSSPSADAARAKLGIPKDELPPPPPLTRDLAKSLLVKLEDGMKIRRPSIAADPKKP